MKTVLLCEDDEGIQEVATIILQEKGYKVELLKETTNIIEEVKNIQPSIILADLYMPHLSGEELTKQLKADATLSFIPIIILSANKDTEKIAKDAGADDFLAKPFNIEDLEAIVEKHLVQ